MLIKPLFMTLGFAAAAFAGVAAAEGPLERAPEFVSVATRAQVQAELAAFKRAGVNPWSVLYNPLARIGSTASRKQTGLEFAPHRGEIHAWTGEDSGSVLLSQQRSGARANATISAE